MLLSHAGFGRPRHITVSQTRVNVVIQCAARKAADAGHLRTQDGRKVMFVANPDLAPRDGDCIYARPDDVSEPGTSWRTVLRQYNENPGDNQLGLLPAWRLYRNPTYEILADRCGLDRLYILSAGWGLIPADFLTPNYDITFSATQNVQEFKRRRRNDSLFDAGYVTVTPDHHFEVSGRIKEEFENGRDYYGLHGESIYVPKNATQKPDTGALSWHNENCLLG